MSGEHDSAAELLRTCVETATNMSFDDPRIFEVALTVGEIITQRPDLSARNHQEM